MNCLDCIYAKLDYDPDGSHTQVNDYKPLQSIQDFARFIVDTLVADRIPETYNTL